MEVQPLDFEKPILELQRRLLDLKNHSDEHEIDFETEVESMERKIRETRRDIYDNLTAWQRCRSRGISKGRSRSITFRAASRIGWSCMAIVSSVTTRRCRAARDDRAVSLRGDHTAEGPQYEGKRDAELGCAYPEGYRKALRLMRIAEKFNLPVISLIDTPGAYPGIGSEERHIAEAIAVNLREMMTLRVPILTVVIGEGGSGGALGIGVADRVMILENAYYSVISPEACSAILWKDRRHAPEAAEALKLTADDLMRLGRGR
jgi:acetyl-CoA carboxylase carboxyl transferase subunit alpha